MTMEDVIGFEALYDSMNKCRRNVARKGSTQSYVVNGLRNTIMLSNRLNDGTYKPRRVNPVHITYPKEREAVANAFIDRVFQRSLNDKRLYPQMSRSFIYENMACQKGKGTDAARELFKKQLHTEYVRNRNSTDVYVLQCDIRRYYDSMRHDYTESIIQKHADADTAKMAIAVLRRQYSGDIGYLPGSQMVQIAGISYLNEFDHWVKEHMRIKNYIRYMDDILIIHSSITYLKNIREKIAEKLKEFGLELNRLKTRCIRTDDGVLFLGFIFRLTKTGKVVMTVDPLKVKSNRIKIRRLVSQYEKGIIKKEDCDTSIECMLAHMEKGDSYMARQRILSYYNRLMEACDERSENGKALAISHVDCV